MQEKEIKLAQLKNKRSIALEMQERERLRTKYGAKLAELIAKKTGLSLSIEDFSADIRAPFPLVWTEKISDAPGLVLTNLLRPKVDSLLTCFERHIGNLSGIIGFHEKPYLGFAHIKNVSPLSMRFIAEETGDSVVIYSDSPAGVLMVDCYTSQAENPFSVLVQGDDLINKLKNCFNPRKAEGVPPG